MLRARNIVTTGSTGVALTVTHGLGQIPDAWWVSENGARGVGSIQVPVATVLTNTFTIRNSLQTTVTVNVFTIFYNGRLY